MYVSTKRFGPDKLYDRCENQFVVHMCQETCVTYSTHLDKVTMTTCKKTPEAIQIHPHLLINYDKEQFIVFVFWMDVTTGGISVLMNT